MSIDEAMENLHAIQTYYNDDMEDSYIGFAKEDNESVDIAIDTMRKYQKIQKIIEEWNNEQINNIICCLDIKKVVEDGNVDC